MAKAELNAEMLRQTRSRAKRLSAAGLKDRRRLTKARIIDVAQVLALKEAKEAQNAGKQSKTRRSKKQSSTVSFTPTTPMTSPRRDQKRVCISEGVSVNFLGPEGTSSEDDWGTETEDMTATGGAEED